MVEPIRYTKLVSPRDCEKVVDATVLEPVDNIFREKGGKNYKLDKGNSFFGFRGFSEETHHRLLADYQELGQEVDDNITGQRVRLYFHGGLVAAIEAIV